MKGLLDLDLDVASMSLSSLRLHAIVSFDSS
jgi:hypothetical protein